MSTVPFVRHRFRRAPGLLPAAPWLVCLCLAASAAAGDAPVYPVFEGWAPRDDGTSVLVFGYHSANTVPITIETGPGNGFVPGPADRGQQTTFLPGRQRNTCRILVSDDFEGNLQWAIAFGGETATTTERGGLDELYLLEEVGSAYRSTLDIDASTAPRGVCLNRAPVIRLAEELAAIGEGPLLLRASVVDDGLPRDGAVSMRWQRVSGPAEVAFSEPTAAESEARFAAPGVYVLRLSAEDGDEVSEADVTVTVTAR